MIDMFAASNPIRLNEIGIRNATASVRATLLFTMRTQSLYRYVKKAGNSTECDLLFVQFRKKNVSFQTWSCSSAFITEDAQRGQTLHNHSPQTVDIFAVLSALLNYD